MSVPERTRLCAFQRGSCAPAWGSTCVFRLRAGSRRCNRQRRYRSQYERGRPCPRGWSCGTQRAGGQAHGRYGSCRKRGREEELRPALEAASRECRARPGAPGRAIGDERPNDQQPRAGCQSATPGDGESARTGAGPADRGTRRPAGSRVARSGDYRVHPPACDARDSGAAQPPGPAECAGGAGAGGGGGAGARAGTDTAAAHPDRSGGRGQDTHGAGSGSGAGGSVSRWGVAGGVGTPGRPRPRTRRGGRDPTAARGTQPPPLGHARRASPGPADPTPDRQLRTPA